MEYITISELRPVYDALEKGEITFSKAVEELDARIEQRLSEQYQYRNIHPVEVKTFTEIDFDELRINYRDNQSFIYSEVKRILLPKLLTHPDFLNSVTVYVAERRPEKTVRDVGLKIVLLPPVNN